MDTRVVIGTINDLYHLDVLQVEPVQKGHLTNNYKVTTAQGDYFLKQHRADNTQNIAFIETVELFFADRDIPVILPILNRQATRHCVFDDRVCTLYPYLDIADHQPANLTPAIVTQLATCLATIHQVGFGHCLDANHVQREVWDSSKALQKLTTIRDLITAKPVYDAFDELALGIIPQKIAFLNTQAKPFADFGFVCDTLIHGDFHRGNVFFDKTGAICAVFDFEKTCFAPRARELARSMFLICLSSDFSLERIELAKLFLRTYHQHYPIDPADFAQGFTAHVMRYMHSTWIEDSHYSQQTNRLDDLYNKSLVNVAFLSRSYTDLIDQLQMSLV